MGCIGSKQGQIDGSELDEKEAPTTKYSKPKWKSTEAITASQLKRMREEFWDTQPHYGGDRVIWDALKAAAAADMDTARLIIDSAGIVVSRKDMTVCYDERGARYELPQFIWSDPSNLSQEDQ